MEKYESFIAENKRQSTFEIMHQKVESITDALGKGVDEGIKDTVAALMVLEFPTVSSCAGHNNDENGYGVPYVMIYAQKPKGWETDERIKKAWIDENNKYKDSMNSYLQEFYSLRETDQAQKIYTKPIGMLGGFEITSYRDEKLKSKEELTSRISIYQNEMKDFTVFIMQKIDEIQRKSQ